MAVVKMRELLRKPKSVFEELERSGEPVLLTRDGQAVAALFPVDPQQAEQLAMAALPEFVQSRARARNARSEGRTTSAAQFVADFESRHGTSGGEPPATPADLPTAVAEPTADPETETEAALVDDLTALFGEELSRELARGMQERIAAASEPVLHAAPAEVASTDFNRRVQQLNCELFGRLLPETLHRTTFDLLSCWPTAVGRGHLLQGESGGMFGRHLAEQTLNAVTARVKSFNCELLDERLGGQALSLPIYEACVKAAKAIERLDLPDRGSPATLVWPTRSRASSI